MPLDDHGRRRIAAYLRDQGGSDEEIEEVLQTGSVGGLALDLVFRAGREVVPFGEAVERAGTTFEEAARLWRALGFPSPTPTHPRLPVDSLPALQQVMAMGRDLIGEEANLAFTRVLGSATSRLAQAMVDFFRVQFETRQLAAGVSYPTLVKQYASLAETMLPVFLETFGAILRRHLVVAASAAWSWDAEGATAQRDTLVGFVDLTGYTALVRTLPPREVARLIDRFEYRVTEATGRHGGRVVKLIGDGAMFSAADAVAGCRIACEIVEAVEELPAMRAGLAAGGVVSMHGDLHGDVVNLAARLVAVAPDRGVVASEEVRARVGDAFAFEPLPPQRLKGFGAPATAYRVAGP